MAKDTIGGWIVDGRLFAKASIANGLWFFTGKDPKAKEAHILFFGWYETDSKVKMWTFDILWVSLQFAYVSKKIADNL